MLAYTAIGPCALLFHLPPCDGLRPLFTVFKRRRSSFPLFAINVGLLPGAVANPNAASLRPPTRS
jgi:hypothetical protein